MKKIWYILALAILFSCSQKPKQPVLIDKSGFETELDGKQVDLYTLKNTMDWWPRLPITAVG